VQNVDTADFAVTGTTAGVTNVATVNASTYDITVSGGDLAGLNATVGLDLTDAQDIVDRGGNALPEQEPATGETYSVVPFDFGDAPNAVQSGFQNSYPTTLLDDGPRHAASSLFLGQLVDAESDGQPDATAGQADKGGDDRHGQDDEDGVHPISSIVASNEASTTASYAVVASQNGLLDAWIDFDQDGDWNSENERIFERVAVSGGVNILPFTVPAGATPGDTAARFRISSMGSLLPTGFAEDGEVEDYLATILDGDAIDGVEVQVRLPESGSVQLLPDGQNAVVRSDSAVLFQAPGSTIQSIRFTGTVGDDFLEVHSLNTIFSGLVGGDLLAGQDTFRLAGSGQALDLLNIGDVSLSGVEAIDITGSGDNTLAIDAQKVTNLSPTTNTLRVWADPGDIVDLGLDWEITATDVENGDFVRVLAYDDVTLRLTGPYDWNNPLSSLDVNASGSVEPLDALIVINELNSPEFSHPDGLLMAAAELDEFPGFFFDAAPDGLLAPRDALVIINLLNRNDESSEGERTVGEDIILFDRAVDAVLLEFGRCGFRSERNGRGVQADEGDRVRSPRLARQTETADRTIRRLCEQPSELRGRKEADESTAALDCLLAETKIEAWLNE
jgi:hypothetical protein